jgi:hypothetical protein
LIEFAAMAPTAIASSVALAIGEASSEVNEPVGSASDASPVVTDAAPTTSSTTQDRNRPDDANSPVRAVDTVDGRYLV